MALATSRGWVWLTGTAWTDNTYQSGFG